MTQSALFESVATLRRAGRSADALRLLRDALRQRGLDAEGIQRAGRIIRKEAGDGGAIERPVEVLLLGQCTTSWLATALGAVAWGQGIPLRVHEGQYDNVLQELSNADGPSRQASVAILLPWHARLLSTEGDPNDRLQRDLQFWQTAWALLAQRGARVIQVGYDWVLPGPRGHLASAQNGPIELVRRLNARLRESLPPDAFFLDLEQTSGLAGRESFYDWRRYHWTKQPFSEEGTCRLARDLSAAIRAVTTGPKKVLVLDLDNTLWGGVVGDLGPFGIGLGDDLHGEAYRSFQRYVKELATRGVLLAVASKNNPVDAREPFEKNSDMVLRLDDFAAFEASWESKDTTIARIAEHLNLGLDSFVFFDDSPAERELIRQSLPMVEVIEVPQDPTDYVGALDAARSFETTSITGEDIARVHQYSVERVRRDLRASFVSHEEYLASLAMVADVRTINEADLQRTVQLLAKTNQFNLTTRRHGLGRIRQMIEMPGAIALTLRLRDRFGDHGLVSILVAVPDDEGGTPVLRIDTWVMSCRVVGRSAERLLFSLVLERSRAAGVERIIGEYIPTSKNHLVATLYEELGFVKAASADQTVVRFALDVSTAAAPASWISLDAGPEASIAHSAGA